MPLDPAIPLGVKPPAIPNPLEIVSTIAQIQGQREQTEARRLAADAARQHAKDEAAVRQVLTETNGDMTLALPRLRTIAPKMALELETEIEQARTKKIEGLRADMDFRGKKLDLGLKVAQSMTDAAGYRAGRPMLLGLAPELEPLLPETFDPAAMERLTNMGLSAKEVHDRRQDGLKLFTEGKATEALGTYFSTARTPEEWAGIADSAIALGTPQALVAQFGSFSPENVARAGQLAIPPKERETLAGQAATRAQTAARDAATQAHQGVLEQQGAQRIALARQRLAKGTGTDRDRTDLMQAVIDNPGLWDQITPTERGKIAGELNARGFTGFGKPLSDGAIKLISESEAAVASLKDLRGVLERNEQYIGPIAGLQALNPYSEARKAQADIDRVRQRVGKTLEGGVLRKEDEEKYKKQLAAITDEPSTALYKVDRIMQDIARDIENYKHNQRLAGRRVPASEPANTDPLTVTAPNGKSYAFKTAAEAAAFKKRAGIP